MTSRLIFLYQVILAVSLLKPLRLVAFRIGYLIQLAAAPKIELLYGYEITNLDKPQELIHYALGIFVIFAILLATGRIQQAVNRRLPSPPAGHTDLERAVYAIAATGFAVLFAGAVWGSVTEGSSLRRVGTSFALWLLFASSPFLFAVLSNDTRDVDRDPAYVRALRRLRIAAYALTASVVLFFGLGISQQLTGRFVLFSEYPEFEEYTIGEHVSAAEKSADFITRSGLAGLAPYVPERDRGRSPELVPGTFFPISRVDNALRNFVAERKGKIALDLTRPAIVFYDRLGSDEVAGLSDLLPAADRPELRKALDEYGAVVRRLKTADLERARFVALNWDSLIRQMMTGWFFHHHGHVYNALGALLAGEKPERIGYTYGWLNTTLLAGIVSAIGDLSLKTYLQVSFSFYLLYLALIALLGPSLARNRDIGLFFAAFAACSFISIGFDSVNVAPGFNPMRHFLDIVVLLVFARAAHQMRWGKNLWLALGIAALQTLIAREFGGILVLAIAIAGLTMLLESGRLRLPAFALSIAAAVTLTCVLLWLLGMWRGPDSSHRLLFLGAFVPGIPAFARYGLLIVVSMSLLLFFFSPAPPRARYSYLAAALYLDGLLFYYVWNPAPNHLAAIGPIIGFVIGLAAANVPRMERPVRLSFAGSVASIVVCIFVGIPSALSFAAEYRSYARQVAAHRVFDWDFERAQLRSTVDPGSVAPDIELLKRHEAQARVYIISRFDSILPFLAGKHSAFGFPDLKASLATSREFSDVLRILNTDKPTLLFVDRDIGRSFCGDIPQIPDPKLGDLYVAATSRVHLYANLYDLFHAVEASYEPIASGRLLTVYRRKPTAKAATVDMKSDAAAPVERSGFICGYASPPDKRR